MTVNINNHKTFVFLLIQSSSDNSIKNIIGYTEHEEEAINWINQDKEKFQKRFYKKFYFKTKEGG